jgi:TolA-binding protein
MQSHWVRLEAGGVVVSLKMGGVMTNDLHRRVERLEVDMEDLKQLVAENARQISQMSGKVDEFVFQAQRLLTNNAERTSIVEGQADRHEATIQRLDRSYEAQQQAQNEFRITTNAALERIDRVLDYLMRQSGREG